MISGLLRLLSLMITALLRLVLLMISALLHLLSLMISALLRVLSLLLSALLHVPPVSYYDFRIAPCPSLLISALLPCSVSYDRAVS